MFNKRLFEKLDYVLLLIIVLLMATGIVALTSAMNVFLTGAMGEIDKQIIWIVISLGAMLVIAAIDYETLGNFSFRWYAIIIILLTAVLFTRPINGASSWFNFGFLSFQPSEIAKIVLIISLAQHINKIVTKDEWGINKPKNMMLLGIHVGLPLILVLKQPDFGTACVIVSIVVAMIFIGNIKFRYVGLAVLLGAVCILLLWYFVSVQKNDLLFSHYQAERIRVFLNPSLDPRGSGYNVLQSQMAIGSGELLGMGLFNGTQTQLGNIPAKTTDFVFAVIGEELGFVVSAIVVVLFVLLMIRCVYIAKISKDFYGTLVSVGVMAMIGVHVFINIGMTMGLVPVTGIPLPFISYGGSSLLTNMMGIGLVLSVSAKSKK
jgi:rod shape determining protein RodA